MGPGPGPPPRMRDGGGHNNSSYGSQTVPDFMNTDGRFGKILILRIQGVDHEGAKKALPKKPLLIRQTIEGHVNKIEGAFPEDGEASYALKVRNQYQYDRLLTLKALKDGTAVEVIPHPYLNSIRCVVSCQRSVDHTEAEIKEMLEGQHVESFRRITRKEGTNIINTPTLILTCQGTVRPEYVDFGYLRCGTRPYYPAPMQCFNCWAFGHTRLRCKTSENTCGTCSLMHPRTENGKCDANAFCKKCKSSEHSLASRSCPEYRKENDIQKMKVDYNLSYSEARRMYESNCRPNSYANVLASTANMSAPPGQSSTQDPSINRVISDLTKKLEQMQEQVQEKDAIITQLLANQQIQSQTQMETIQRAISESMAQLQDSFSSMIQASIQGFNRRLSTLENEIKKKDKQIRKHEEALALSKNLLKQAQNSCNNVVQVSKSASAAPAVTIEAPVSTAATETVAIELPPADESLKTNEKRPRSSDDSESGSDTEVGSVSFISSDDVSPNETPAKGWDSEETPTPKTRSITEGYETVRSRKKKFEKAANRQEQNEDSSPTVMPKEQRRRKPDNSKSADNGRHLSSTRSKSRSRSPI